MTGNLKIISDSRIRYIVSKGPKYRFPSHWSCIAHLSAEDMLKSAVIAERSLNIAFVQGKTTH